MTFIGNIKPQDVDEYIEIHINELIDQLKQENKNIIELLNKSKQWHDIHLDLFRFNGQIIEFLTDYKEHEYVYNKGQIIKTKKGEVDSNHFQFISDSGKLEKKRVKIGYFDKDNQKIAEKMKTNETLKTTQDQSPITNEDFCDQLKQNDTVLVEIMIHDNINLFHKAEKRLIEDGVLSSNGKHGYWNREKNILVGFILCLKNKRYFKKYTRRGVVKDIHIRRIFERRYNITISEQFKPSKRNQLMGYDADFWFIETPK